MYTPEGYKAVCYRCSYESCDARVQRCPVCQFAFIFEAETTPPGRRIESILRRPAVGTDGPPLPGVHVEKRKAQLLAESRQERRRARSSQLRPVTVEPRIGGGTVVASAGARRLGRLGFALVCASAVAAGALAAVLQHGWL